MAVVLKSFPWSRNGIDVEYLVPGDVRDFGASEAALAADGYVRSAHKQEAVVEPPVAHDGPAEDPPADSEPSAPAEEPQERRGRRRK